MSRTSWSQALGVVSVAAYAVFGLLAGLDARSAGTGIEIGEEAADDFLGAWERSLRGTYVAEEEFVRTGPDGGELRTPSRVVRRPPDSLTVGFDTVEGYRDDEVVRCTDSSGGRRCRTAPAGSTHGERVTAELEALRGYVVPPDPFYDVTAGADGCFELARRRFHPLSPYGRLARFCFDAATGAVSLARVEHDNGIVDRRIAHEIRAEVTEEDLVPPP